MVEGEEGEEENHEVNLSSAIFIRRVEIENVWGQAYLGHGCLARTERCELGQRESESSSKVYPTS